MARVKVALFKARPQLAGKATIDEERWEANVLHYAITAEGQHFSGTLTVEDNQFDLYAKLPLMMKLFEGKIEKAIIEQVSHMLK